MTTLDQVQKATAEVKALQQKRIDACPHKAGDVVSYKDRLWRVIGVYDWPDSGGLNVKLRNGNTQSIGWTSNYTFVKEADLYSITPAENPGLDAHALGDLEERIAARRENIADRTKDIAEAERQIAQLAAEADKLRAGCIHDWDEGRETGETEKHFIGESEVKVLTCRICGTEGRNV